MSKISTSTLSLFSKGIKIGFSNITRNKFLSIATIFVIGIIVFIFNIILSINFIANNALSNLSQKVDLTVYVKDGVAYQEVQGVINEISKLKNTVEITYTSKDKALQQLKTSHPNLILAFEKYDLGNPLPASINIKTSHPKYHEEILNLLSQDQYAKSLSLQGFSEMDNTEILTSVSKNLLDVSTFTNQIIFWLIVTFLIGGALIILNALQITIFGRKKEIGIMKLVGAPHWFIRLPYLVESVVYGILAVLFGFLMFLIVNNNFNLTSSGFFNWINFPKYGIIFISELLFSVFICAVSSNIAVHSHINKPL